jgi:hypothetical protein
VLLLLLGHMGLMGRLLLLLVATVAGTVAFLATAQAGRVRRWMRLAETAPRPLPRPLLRPPELEPPREDSCPFCCDHCSSVRSSLPFAFCGGDGSTSSAALSLPVTSSIDNCEK